MQVKLIKMFKKDLKKLKKVLTHSDNKRSHIPAIKNYIQLFYSKWTKPHQRKQTEPLIKKYCDLLESC